MIQLYLWIQVWLHLWVGTAIGADYSDEKSFVEAEKSNCFESRDQMSFEKITLNRSTTLKGNPAVLICLRRFRDPEVLFKIMASEPKIERPKTDGAPTQIFFTPIRAALYSSTAQIIPLEPIRQLIFNQTGSVHFIEPKARDASLLPAYLLLSVEPSIKKGSILNTGTGTQSYSVPIYGAGSMLIENSFQYQLIAHDEEKYRATWVSKSSDQYQKSKPVELKSIGVKSVDIKSKK